MRNVVSKTKELVKAIEESEQYIQYQSAIKKLEKYPELLAKVNEYRKKRFAFQVEGMESSQSAQNELQSLFTQIRGNELVLDFLSAEKDFSSMMRQVNHAILDGIDMNVDFLGV